MQAFNDAFVKSFCYTFDNDLKQIPTNIRLKLLKKEIKV